MLVIEFPLVHGSLSPIDKLRQRKLVTKIRAQFCGHIFTGAFHMLDLTVFGGRYPLDTSRVLRRSHLCHREFLGATRGAVWVAHASRVLVSASRRNDLSFDFRPRRRCESKGKFAIARRNRQHARRARYPEASGLRIAARSFKRSAFNRMKPVASV